MTKPTSIPTACRCIAQRSSTSTDTPYHVEAALRAGIDIIALRCGGWSDQELKGAIATYADPADLLEHYDLSPFKRPAPLRSA